MRAKFSTEILLMFKLSHKFSVAQHSHIQYRRTWWDYRPRSEVLRRSACCLFTSIFNESLATSVIPTSFKKSVIIPVPKNSKPSCLNDYRPVALTSTVMKVFERLLKKHICTSIPATLDPLQFAYRPIGLLMMPSLRYCTPPSHILTAKMATMSDCYSWL